MASEIITRIDRRIMRAERSNPGKQSLTVMRYDTMAPYDVMNMLSATKRKPQIPKQDRPKLHRVDISSRFNQ